MPAVFAVRAGRSPSKSCIQSEPEAHAATQQHCLTDNPQPRATKRQPRGWPRGGSPFLGSTFGERFFFFAKKNLQFWKIEKQKSKKYANTRYFKSRTLFAEEIINLRNGLGFVVRSVCARKFGISFLSVSWKHVWRKVFFFCEKNSGVLEN